MKRDGSSFRLSGDDGDVTITVVTPRIVGHWGRRPRKAGLPAWGAVFTQAKKVATCFRNSGSGMKRSKSRQIVSVPLAKTPDRFLAGTDTWFTSRSEALPGSVAEVRTYLYQLPLDDAEKIAYKNAERLFP